MGQQGDGGCTAAWRSRERRRENERLRVGERKRKKSWTEKMLKKIEE